jgi:hypothetical protein
MGCAGGVPAGVLPRGVIAAANVPAFQTDPQVHPDATLPKAIDAAVHGGGEFGHLDRVQMRAACMSLHRLSIPKPSSPGATASSEQAH